MSIIFPAAGGARPGQNLIMVITGNQTEARANKRRDTASPPLDTGHIDNPGPIHPSFVVFCHCLFVI